MQWLNPAATCRKSLPKTCHCAVLQEMGIVMLEEDYRLLLAEDQRTLQIQGKAGKGGPNPAAAPQPVRILNFKRDPITNK